ncbi:MAG: hypothetical protein QXT82_12095 [Candidatus Caldarchaeum sp.]
MLSVEELREVLEKGKDFMRVPVRDVSGLFIFRFPATPNSPASLAVEINPVRKDGTLTKETGLLVFSSVELKQQRIRYVEESERLKALIQLLSDARLETLVNAVETVNLKMLVKKPRFPEVAGISIEELKEMLEMGRNWMRIPVNGMPGVFVVKVPAENQSPEHLAVELNPLKEDGTPRQPAGYRISSRDDIQEYRTSFIEKLEEVNACLKILSYPGLDTLVINLEEVNLAQMKNRTRGAKSGEDG